MKESILKQRLKGLMALTLAFMLMFGSSLTVLASNPISVTNLTSGTRLSQGTVIEVTTGGMVYIDNVQGETIEGRSDGSYPQYTLQRDFIFDKYNSTNGYLYLKSVPVDTNSGSGHTHDLKWIIGLEPTETSDGEYEYRCTDERCGHVEARQPISLLGVVVKKIIKAIEEAPENGTVVIDDQFLRCFSDEIVEALLARPDVTVDVRFTEKEVDYRFVIPAGKAPADEQEWYGYFYLGALYGWQEPVKEEEIF